MGDTTSTTSDETQNSSEDQNVNEDQNSEEIHDADSKKVNSEDSTESNSEKSPEKDEDSTEIEALRKSLEEWKGFSRKHENGFKSARAEIDTLRSQLTESQNALSKLQQEVEETKISALKSELAQEAGLPKNLLRFITSSDVDGIKSDISELVGATKKSSSLKNPLFGSANIPNNGNSVGGFAAAFSSLNE